ncbi:Carboxylesterase [Mycotypha africana]|uniref:Carboxylesterase n=1 Tax=Mycotypha africana TaxID=64632 RepID=UPI002300DDC4|nr:Carboxylesterase [Mycotypha africana]KAI8987942.1 Carboxylesterase [Mycotypha africana]
MLGSCDNTASASPTPPTISSSLRTSSSPHNDQDPTPFELLLTDSVPTTSGKIQGFIDAASEVQVFLGIPYAEPPVGALRYKKPIPLKAAHIQRQCIKHAPAAPQTAMPFDTLMSVQIDYQSEDCLYLNIWVPTAIASVSGNGAMADKTDEQVSKDEKKPLSVIVWVHPGACMSGSSSQPFWDGTNLAARNNTIIVSFNYRLGSLGWMSMDHLSPELEGTANLGLLDQIVAFRWVQDNIEHFGGDPNNVTAFGSSAGASCIMSIILSPDTAGLFQRVVLQSPPMFMVSPKNWAEFKGTIFARSIGMDVLPGSNCVAESESSSLLTELQSVEVGTFLDSQTFMTTWPNFLEGLAPIGPSVDGHVIPSHTIVQHFFHYPLPRGYENLEIMIGYTRDEFNFFFPFLPNFQDMDETLFVRTYFTHVFGRKYAQQAYDIYQQQIVPPMSPPSEVSRYMCSDVMSRVATLLTAENLTRWGHKVYVYEWNYESNDVQNVIKAAHMVDTVFSWDNLAYWANNPFLGSGDDIERDRVAKQISGAITQFAKTGNPNHDKIPDWPVYSKLKDNSATASREARRSLVFEREVFLAENIYATGLHLWKTVLKDFVRTPLFPVTASNHPSTAKKYH